MVAFSSESTTTSPFQVYETQSMVMSQKEKNLGKIRSVKVLSGIWNTSTQNLRCLLNILH